MEIKSKRLHLHTNQGLNTMKEIKLEINMAGSGNILLKKESDREQVGNKPG